MFNYDKFNDENNIILLEKLKDEIEAWDNNFFKNHYDRSKYKMRKKQNKIMITEYGKITYNRRIYQDLKTKEYICFTDLNFGIEKKQQIPLDLKNKILSNLGKGNTLLEIKSKFPKSNLSTTVISKILSSQLPYQIENVTKKKLP